MCDIGIIQYDHNVSYIYATCTGITKIRRKKKTAMKFNFMFRYENHAMSLV